MMLETIGRIDRRRPALLPALLLVAGCVLRIVWTAASHSPHWATAEIANVAVAYAKTGTLADAYLPGQGPTAHVNPITTIFAGTVYHLFGIRSALSETILASCSIAIAMCSFLAFYLFFGQLKSPRWARLLALTACCFVPLYQGMETSEFRIWEGGLSVLLAITCMLALVAIDDRTRSRMLLKICAITSLAAVTFFLSPSLGLAVYAAVGLWVVSNQPFQQWPISIVAAVIALTAMIAPWAIRNERQLGSPVLLRSNFGLELAMGYDPKARAATDKARQFEIRQSEIHPFGSPENLTKMRSAGGEVAYAQGLGEQTKAWMKRNASEAAIITVQHIIDYWFPPRWQLALYYRSSRLDGIRQAILWIISFNAIIGALLALFRRQQRWLYPVFFILAPTALYAFTQPVLRYHYLVFAMSLFLGADALSQCQRLIAGRKTARADARVTSTLAS